jgi:DNA replication protein DnaC
MGELQPLSNISRLPIVRKQRGTPQHVKGRKYTPIRLSDAFFLTLGGKPTREEALWVCEHCGPIEPKEYANGYTPGKCECHIEQLEQYRAQQARQFQISQEQSMRAQRCGNCYTWLGSDLSSGVIHTLESYTFESYVHPELQPEGFYAALHFANNPYGNLVLCGKTAGTGKTHLGAAIVNYLLAQNIPCLWAKAQDVFTAFANRMDDHKGYTDLLIQAGSYDVMVLDDLDKVHVSQFKHNIFFDILDKRYMRHLPTVITTNVHVEMTRTELVGISAYVGEYAASRLAAQDNGGITIVEMNGEDYRRRTC